MLVQAVFLLAVSAAGTLAQRPSEHRACNQTELNMCQRAFNKALGITETLGVNSSAQLADALESSFGHDGTNGLALVCHKVRGFKSCFTNPREYDECLLNPLGLLGDDSRPPQSTGISEKNARNYVRLFAQLDFACGPGFSHFQNANENVLTKNCAADVFEHNLPSLRDCQDAFERSRAVDPQDTCDYAMQSANCYMFLFRKCKEQGMWFGCEYQRTGLQTAYGECSQNFCKFNPPE